MAVVINDLGNSHMIKGMFLKVYGTIMKIMEGLHANK